MKTETVAAVAVALTLCGCGASESPLPAAGGPQPYRAAVFTSADDEIPFFLELPANCNTERAVVVNGAEHISIPCRRIGARLLLDFVVYGTRIAADIGGHGHLTGQWSHTGGHVGADERMRFVATPIDRLDPAVRFIPSDRQAEAVADGDLAGTWKIAFDSGETAKATFRTVGDGIVHGTAEVPSEYGDLRYLAGNMRGSSLSLSTFDGTGAYLVRARLQDDERLHGELVRADGSRSAFVAMRSDDFEVVDPLQRVRVTSAEKRLDFAPLLSPRYARKPVIVELFGTWCANCNDLAPLLADLYAEHHAEGLEILSVAFELSADEQYVRERVAEYKAAHGIEWEVMIPAAPPEQLLSAGPARLSAISGVPVTLFFNRDRTVRAIYSGFSGPATGATHQKTTATFRQLTKEILASK